MENAHTFTLRLTDLLARERAALGEFLVQLAAFDERRLWLELGYASLFDFLHRELGLSKGAAFYRKTAAELVRRFPEIVAPLRDGRLCFTSVVELSKVLTAENRDEVLPRFFQLSKREAKAVSAALRPAEAAPHREVVTAVRAARTAAAPASALGPSRGVPPELPNGRAAADLKQELVHPDEPRRANTAPGTPMLMMDGQTSPPTALPSAVPSAPRRPPSGADPLTADLSRLHVTVSRRFLAKLEAARAALSHSHPGASADAILEAGLDLLLERQAKRRGLVEKPRREPPAASPKQVPEQVPEHVPAHVKRAVWERDGGRCRWPLEGGGICGSTHRLELDHVLPRARGGPSTIENLRVLCGVHNQRAARLAFGEEWMDRCTGRPRAPASRLERRPHPPQQAP